MLTTDNSKLLNINLSMFNANANKTTDEGLSGEMKTFYSDYLVDFARPALVHDDFAQKHPIPKNGGKIIEFRKYSQLPKLTTALSEGVTPDGQALSMSTITAEVKQYGGYITLSDILLLAAIDNNLVQATELLGDQAGRTLDTISREVLNGGTNVIYGEDAVSARHLLVGGEASDNHYLTVNAVKRAVRKLKVMNAKPVDGKYYGAIIHPDCTFDLTEDSNWKKPHEYVDTENIYSGEIGSIAGARFVETSESKIFAAENLTTAARNLTVASWTVGTKTVTVDEALSAAEATALKGRTVIIKGQLCTIASAVAGDAAAASIVLTAVPTTAPAAADIVYPGEAGANGRDVYSTIFFGKNAYGTIEIEGGGLEHIVKQLGSAGTADPLDQRATAGWKATKTTKRLVEENMVRLETASTFASGSN